MSGSRIAIVVGLLALLALGAYVIRGFLKTEDAGPIGGLEPKAEAEEKTDPTQREISRSRPDRPDANRDPAALQGNAAGKAFGNAEANADASSRYGRLKIVIDTADHGPTSPFFLQLAASKPFWADETSWSAAPGLSVLFHDPATPLATFLADPAKGAMTMHDLLPGIPITVGIADMLLTGFESATVSVNAGETKELTLTFPGARRPFSGTVADDAGNPIVHARVTVSLPDPGTPAAGFDTVGKLGSRAREKYTDASGAFRFESTFAPKINVVIEAEGFAWFEKKGLALPDEGGRAKFVLDRGRTVVVKIVNADGSPAATDTVVARSADGTEIAKCMSPNQGPFALYPLPQGRVKFEVVIHKKSYTVEHDTAIPQATLQLPALAQAKISWPRAFAGDATYGVELADESQGIEARQVFTAEAAANPGQVTISMLPPGTYAVYSLRITKDPPSILKEKVGDLSVADGMVAEMMLP